MTAREAAAGGLADGLSEARGLSKRLPAIPMRKPADEFPPPALQVTAADAGRACALRRD